MTNETSANPLRLAELMAARLCHDKLSTLVISDGTGYSLFGLK